MIHETNQKKVPVYSRNRSGTAVEKPSSSIIRLVLEDGLFMIRRDYKAYIFDFNDTLVQTFDHVLDVLYPTVASEFGLICRGKSAAIKHWGTDFDIFFQHVFEGKYESQKLISRITELQYSQPEPAFVGVQHMLRNLIQQKRFVAIYTSGIRPIIENSIERCLAMDPEEFSLIFCTPDYGVTKPNRLIADEVVKEFYMQHDQHITPSEMVFIGDAPGDLKTAELVGADYMVLPAVSIRKIVYLSLVSVRIDYLIQYMILQII